MNLEDSFPHLSLFSDIDWKAVTQEYEQTSKYVTFPEYLELKAEEGDCPHHLFELAYFDAALAGLQEGEFLFPGSPGIHLNPSARFLSLEYDILKMVQEAHEGRIAVLEKQNVLCLFVDSEGEIRFHELTGPELSLLQSLEDGAPSQDHPALGTLVSLGLVLSVN